MLILFATALILLIVVFSSVTAHRLVHPPRKTFAVALAKCLPTDPQSAGLDGKACRFKLPGDHWCEGFDICGCDPDGPVVIFTHGWSDSRFGALTWAEPMVEFVSRLVVYDLRGHGDSPARCCHLGTVEVDDLHSIIDQVDGLGGMAQDEARPLVLWGHSLGAMVTLAAASDRCGPSPIAGVIVDGLVCNFAEAVAGRLRLMRLPARLLTPLAMGMLALWDGRIFEVRSTSAASGLPCPLLMLHGGSDFIASPSAAQAVATISPNAHLAIFPGAGHGNLAEFDAGRYRAELARFFDGISEWKSPEESTTHS